MNSENNISKPRAGCQVVGWSGIAIFLIWSAIMFYAGRCSSEHKAKLNKIENVKQR